MKVRAYTQFASLLCHKEPGFQGSDVRATTRTYTNSFALFSLGTLSQGSHVILKKKLLEPTHKHKSICLYMNVLEHWGIRVPSKTQTVSIYLYDTRTLSL